MYRVRELVIEAPEYFPLDFCVFASVVLYVKKNQLMIFPPCFSGVLFYYLFQTLLF